MQLRGRTSMLNLTCSWRVLTDRPPHSQLSQHAALVNTRAYPLETPTRPEFLQGKITTLPMQVNPLQNKYLRSLSGHTVFTTAFFRASVSQFCSELHMKS